MLPEKVMEITVGFANLSLLCRLVTDLSIQEGVIERNRKVSKQLLDGLETMPRSAPGSKDSRIT